MRRLLLFVLLVALATPACGKKFKPLDPKDMTLSAETRGWVADAEDGVIAARARRDWARLNLKQIEAWREGNPLKKNGDAAHIAKAIKFIVNNDFINGETLDINGGLFMR